MGQKISWQDLDLVPIVMAAKAGSSPAFDELVRRYKSATIGVAFSILGQPELAEDIAQETFLVAYRAMHQLKRPNRFPSWICAIARNRAIRCLHDRKKENLVPLLDQEASLIANFRTIADPGEELDQAEVISQLHRLLLLLAPEYRVVIDLRYWRGLKTKDIGESLGIPETTVKWRLHKGMDLLRQVFNHNPNE